jgi:hypothetical protein
MTVDTLLLLSSFRFKHDVDTRAAKAEEERRMLELQAIRRAAEERDYRAATLLQVRGVAPFFLFLFFFSFFLFLRLSRNSPAGPLSIEYVPL